MWLGVYVSGENKGFACCSFHARTNDSVSHCKWGTHRRTHAHTHIHTYDIRLTFRERGDVHQGGAEEEEERLSRLIQQVRRVFACVSASLCVWGRWRSVCLCTHIHIHTHLPIRTHIYIHRSASASTACSCPPPPSSPNNPSVPPPDGKGECLPLHPHPQLLRGRRNSKRSQ